MGVWETYTSRCDVRGENVHDATLIRGSRSLLHKSPDNLSYHSVLMYAPEYTYNIDENYAEDRNVSIINSDNLEEKTIISLPGEDITNGSVVWWMDNYWLITERDANTTLYTRAKMTLCNYLLKWVTEDKDIIEQWCVVGDGTKYLTGEYEDRNFVVTRGDTRLGVMISKNQETERLTRQNRFIIDDPMSPQKMAYVLSKPLKVGTQYGGFGIFKFVLQEVTTTEFDNLDLGIADYYKYFNATDQQAGSGSGSSGESSGGSSSGSSGESSGDVQNEGASSGSSGTSGTSGKRVWI